MKLRRDLVITKDRKTANLEWNHNDSWRSINFKSNEHASSRSQDQWWRSLSAWQVARELIIFLRLGKYTSGKISLHITTWVCLLSSNPLWRSYLSLDEQHQNDSVYHINLRIMDIPPLLKSSRHRCSCSLNQVEPDSIRLHKIGSSKTWTL